MKHLLGKVIFCIDKFCMNMKDCIRKGETIWLMHK